MVQPDIAPFNFSTNTSIPSVPEYTVGSNLYFDQVGKEVGWLDAPDGVFVLSPMATERSSCWFLSWNKRGCCQLHALVCWFKMAAVTLSSIVDTWTVRQNTCVDDRGPILGVTGRSQQMG